MKNIKPIWFLLYVNLVVIRCISIYFGIKNMKDKVKVLMVIPSYYPAIIYGGPIFSTMNTCAAINKDKINVFVSTTNANGKERLNINPNVAINELGYPVKYYNELVVGRFSFRLLINVWKDILPADVVHIQSIFSTPTPISLFYCWLFSRKIILSPRGALGEWCLNKGNFIKKWWLRFLIKPFLKNVIWHATSEQEKNDILRLFDSTRIKIIPNGIDFEELSSSKVREDYFSSGYDVGRSSRIIVSMGRLERKKGFDILIKSISKIINDGQDVRLFIAGPDYGELSNLTELSRDLGIEDKVIFVGNISGDDKVNFFGAADVFAMPSHNENFGNVYAESLACGTPIVASKNTPWQDVEKYGCGKWVDNTVEATTSAILELLSEDRLSLKEKSRKFVKKYTWNHVAYEFEKLYQELS